MRAEDFWTNVNIGHGSTCWNWTRGLHTSGYGWLRWDGAEVKAHRLAWELTNGPLPIGDGYHGACVLHRCDNRKCINPDHLFLGTHADNMADMVGKGRASRKFGPANGRFVHGERVKKAA